MPSQTVTIAGFETVNYTIGSNANGQTVTIDLTGLTGATSFNYDSSGASADDTLKMKVGTITNATSSLSIDAGTGTDVLQLTAGGTLTSTHMSNITGFDTITLASDAIYGITLNNVSQATTINGSAVTTSSNSVNVDGSGVTNNVVLTITGGAGNDTLYGGAGADVISGGAGDNNMRGLGGNDTLTGGSGTDVFIFEASASNNGQDTINSFTAGTDKIDLSNFDTVGSTLDWSSHSTETLTAGKVYYSFGLSAGAADGASISGAAKSAIDTAGVYTDAAVTSYLVLSDDNSSSVWQWTGDGGADESNGDTFTLLATIDDAISNASDITV